MQRGAPLEADVEWSFEAGPQGGLSTNTRTGLTVAVPPGALSQNVRITVTALKGKPVAYRFSPHLVFDKKVYLTQDLRGTSADGLVTGLFSRLLLKGAHFPGDVPVYNGGLAIVDEVVPALLSALTRTATFGVGHFTGWILASGNEGAAGSME